MAEDKLSGLLGIDDTEFGEIPLTDNLAWLRHRIEKFTEGGVYPHLFINCLKTKII